MPDDFPMLSVIVPMHNCRGYINRSLAAIRASTYPNFELIVVDDASTDDSAQIAAPYADCLISLKEKSGPAHARNAGAAKSKGEILLSLDADVEVAADTLSRVASYMRDNPDLAALFCSYDASPLELNFFSQYKNLFHHFVHQNSKRIAFTFWSGCGAVRKEMFVKVAGFPEENETLLEDVALGYKITSCAGSIELVKEIQVKHLKKWTFFSLIKTDILKRAIPWSILIFKRRSLPYDLNFKFSDRASALLSLFLVLTFIFSWYWKFLLPGLIVFSAALFLLNRRLYKFFYQKKGIFFAFRSVLFHWFYLFYSLLAFALVGLKLLFSRKNCS